MTPRRTADDSADPDGGGPPSRLRPWLLAGVAVLFIARPLIPSDAPYRGDGVLFVLLWLLLAWVWGFWQTRVGPRTWRVGWADVAVAALIVIYTLSALVAIRHGSPRPAMNVLWEWIAFGAGFFLVRQLIVSAVETRALIAAMMALAAALSVIGLYQYTWTIPRDRAEYEQIKDDPAKMVQVVGQWYPPDSPARTRFEDRLYGSEPTATFALANSLAGFLAPWLIVFMAIVLAWIGVAGSAGRPWLATALIAAPMAGCLLLTKSRSGYVAVGVGAVLLWIARKRSSGNASRRWIVVAILAIATVAAAAAWRTGGLDAQVVTQAGQSLGYRLQYWQSALAMIGDHPWLGCGPGQFQDVYTFYKLPEASEEIRDPHNFLIEVWATAGTLALVALGAVLVYFSAHALKAPGTVDCQVADPQRDAAARTSAHALLAGVPAGVAFAAVAGLPVAMPLGTDLVLITLAVSCVTILLLYPWVLRGPNPARLPALAVLVLLVHLLAAGGIGYPGVSGTLWMMLAIGLNQADGRQNRWRWSGITAWSPLAMLAALIIVFYTTTYRPVLHSRGLLRQASVPAVRNDPRALSAVLADARKADPYSAEAARMQAEHRFQVWQRDPSPANLELFESAAGDLGRLAPRSSATWAALGGWYAKVSKTSDSPRHLHRALDAYQRAAALYPTSAAVRADWAVVLDQAGQEGEARAQAREALRLDAITRQAGHRDRLLSEADRRRVEELAGGD